MCFFLRLISIGYNLFMQPLISKQTIDYLLVGHVTKDTLPSGSRLGGTVTYSALLARALGLRVGIVTAINEEVSLALFGGIPIINYPTNLTTTFENTQSITGRQQIIHEIAPTLTFSQIPENWMSASIVHLAPVAQEVEPTLVRNFPTAFIGVTPQGWLRSWNSSGQVSYTEWPEASFVLNRSGAAVISVDDIQADEERIEELATYCPVLAVTEGKTGTRLYWNGDVRRFRPPEVEEVDSTGAGDIFATAFFIRLFTTRDPWEAARFATIIAAQSVSRHGLDAIPTTDEIDQCLVEVL